MSIQQRSKIAGCAGIKAYFFFWNFAPVAQGSAELHSRAQVGQRPVGQMDVESSP